MFIMNNKLTLTMVASVFALAMGIGVAWAKPVCNTTTSSKCTSGGESCTKSVEKCTTFNPDGTTTIKTTTSHDCGPGGPKDCGGKAASIRSTFPKVISATSIKTVDAPPRKPRVPVKRVDQGQLEKKQP